MLAALVKCNILLSSVITEKLVSHAHCTQSQKISRYTKTHTPHTALCAVALNNKCLFFTFYGIFTSNKFPLFLLQTATRN
jgi:hypothetical protein